MPDYSLVPVDYQPDFSGYSLVPVDYDPFADDTTPQAAARPENQPQPRANGADQPNVGTSTGHPQATEPGESWDPDTESGGALDRTAASNPSAAPTASYDKPTYDWSRYNLPFGELKPATYTPTQRIGNLAADVLMGAGMQPYTANDLARRIGNLLGLTPLGVAGSALDLIDAKRRDDLPGAAMAALGMIPGAKGVGRVAAEEAAAGLRTLATTVSRSPASRAAEKGFSGIGTTPNGGPTLAGTEHLYPAGEGQRSVVPIRLSGSRRDDYDLANKAGGFTEIPKGYMWHYVDDFNPQTGMGSLELVDKDAHRATTPHTGSVAQYEKFHGVRYKR